MSGCGRDDEKVCGETTGKIVVFFNLIIKYEIFSLCNTIGCLCKVIGCLYKVHGFCITNEIKY